MIRAIPTTLVVIFALVVCIFLAAVLVFGTVVVAEFAPAFALTIAAFALLVLLFVFLPFQFIGKAPRFTRFGLLACALIFALNAWIFGYLTTYQYWGSVGIFIGLVLGIIGVIGTGIIASAMHYDWLPFGLLVVGSVLAVISGAFAIRKATISR